MIKKVVEIASKMTVVNGTIVMMKIRNAFNSATRKDMMQSLTKKKTFGVSAQTNGPLTSSYNYNIRVRKIKVEERMSYGVRQGLKRRAK